MEGNVQQWRRQQGRQVAMTVRWASGKALLSGPVHRVAGRRAPGHRLI